MNQDVRLIWEAYKKRSSFEILKSNKQPLTDEERQQAISAGCVWHHGPNGKATCAIWKGKDGAGKVWFVANTHRMYQKAPTLSEIIKKWPAVKQTA